MNQGKCTSDLLHKGIYNNRVDNNIVQYFDSTYFNSKDDFEFKKDYNQFFKQINLDDQFITKIFVDPILSILESITDRKVKVRDIFAVITEPTNNNLSGHASKWHTDYANSFAMMLLINDISINDPHMQFVPNIKHDSGTRTDCLTTDLQYINCIGECGTYYLFNNGFYLHRAFLNGNKPRKTLHAVYI